LQTGGIEAFAQRWAERPLFSSRKSLPDELQKQIRAVIVRQDPQGLAAALAGAGLSQQPYLLEDASALPVPVLVVMGEFDEKFNRLGAQIAAAAQRARCTTIAKAGHTPHWENPVAFLETVRTFLSAADAAPKTGPHGQTVG
jgi:2-succinyl-6-hydroxy-2,4-cyclohexadiene-1-carboxylate synthase